MRREMLMTHLVLQLVSSPVRTYIYKQYARLVVVRGSAEVEDGQSARALQCGCAACMC